MKLALVAAALLAALATASTAAGTTQMKATVSGTCVTVLHLNVDGVVDRSTVTCTVSGPCSCDQLTKVAYQTVTISPGNGSSGLEHGSIDLTGSRGSLSLALRGTATALGASRGTWSLSAASGAVARGTLTRHGTYSSTWTTSNPVTGTMSAKVRIAMSFSCAVCAAAH